MQRIDTELFQRNFFPSRQKAAWAVKEGCVRLNGKIVAKPSTKVNQQDEIIVQQPLPYVSRGGLKLEKGIRVFGLELHGKTVLDIGCSTGGFADCALQHGAAFVYGIDVGENQLAEKLKHEPQLKYIERLHIKHLTRKHINDALADVILTDVSFISSKLIFPYLLPFLHSDGSVFTLIKPQFELNPKALDKNGIVRKENDHLRAVEGVIQAALEAGLHLKAIDFAPLTTYKKNIEYIAYFTLKDHCFCPNTNLLVQTAFAHRKNIK